jgi:WD40 repeat protein
VSQDKTIKVFDFRTPVIKATATIQAHAGEARFAILSKKGQTLFTGGTDNVIKVWQLPKGALLGTLAGHGAAVTCGALSADGKILVTGSWDRTLHIWDVETARAVGVMNGHADTINAVALSPDRKTAASGGNDRVLRLWDVEARELRFTSPEQNLLITAVAFSPDSELVATATGDWEDWRRPGEIKLWNAKTGAELASLPGHTAQANAVEFSPDGRRLATGAGSHLRIWDVASRKLISESNTRAGLRRIVWFPDGDRLALARYPGQVGIWDLKTARMETVFAGHEKMVQAVAVRSDGALVVSAADDGTVRLWPVPANDNRK